MSIGLRASTRLAVHRCAAAAVAPSPLPERSADSGRRRSLRRACGTARRPDFRGIWQARDTAYVNIEGHPGGKRHRRLRRASSSIRPMGRFRTNRRRSRSGKRTIERGRRPIRRSSVIKPAFPARLIFRLRCRFFRAPATLRSCTRTIMRSASFTRTRGRTSTARTGGWATRVIDGRATRWLPTSSRSPISCGWTRPETFTAREIHIVERYRMTGADTIEYEARIEDPGRLLDDRGRCGPFLHRVKRAGRADHRGRMPGGRERRAPACVAVRSRESARGGLLEMEDCTLHRTRSAR